MCTWKEQELPFSVNNALVWVTYKANWWVSPSTISISLSLLFFSFPFLGVYFFNWHLTAKREWRILRNFPVQEIYKIRTAAGDSKSEETAHAALAWLHLCSLKRMNTSMSPKPQKRCMTCETRPCWQTPAGAQSQDLSQTFLFPLPLHEYHCGRWLLATRSCLRQPKPAPYSQGWPPGCQVLQRSSCFPYNAWTWSNR